MTRPRTAGELLSQREHTELAADTDAQQDVVASEAATASAQDYIDANPGKVEDAADTDDDDGGFPSVPVAPGGEADAEHEDKFDELREQLNGLVDDAEEDELKLTDFQRYWRRLQEHVLHHVNTMWRLDGPTRDAAAHIGSIVKSGQITGSYMSQLYAATHFGAKFEPFEPNDSILERPGVDKLDLYSRPIREHSLKAQLNRLETLVNTDLQLSKVRTLYSAFDEDQKTNRTPIKIYKRVTSGEKPCALCEIAADQVYFTDDLMPIHDNCMCDIEVGDASDLDEHKAAYHHIGFVQTLLDTGDQKKVIQTLADEDAPIEDYHNLVKVEQHGELGPVIVWAGQKFTGPADLPDPMRPRPVPTLSGPGITHEARLARNRARVEQYRRQNFGEGGRPEPQYHPEHGKGSSHVAPAPYGLPPVAKTAGPKPKPKIPEVNLGKVVATIGPGGKVTLDKAVKPTLDKIDWENGEFNSLIRHMSTAHSNAVPASSWHSGGWDSPLYDDLAKRRTLQAIDEMLTKYPDVKVGAFRIAPLDPGVVAEVNYSNRLDGTITSMSFSRSVMRLRPSEMKERFKQSEDAGFYFTDASKDPYRAMVYHEYGHVLDVRGQNRARAETNSVLARLFAETGQEPSKSNLEKWMGEKDRLSGYSMQDYAVPGKISPVTGKPASLALDSGEAIAQAFDDYERRGDAASDVSKALHDLVVERSTIEFPTGPLAPEGQRAASLAEPKLSAVERLQQVTEPKPPWSAADMAKEDNHNLTPELQAHARDLATRVWIKGASIEPTITAAVKASVQQNGGYMSGLDFRLKTGPSLYRKIQAEAIGLAGNKPADVTTDMLDRAAMDIKDAVRYTGIMPAEGYWNSGDNLRKALESLGANTIKDPQGIPLEGYRGRNMAFVFHDSPFELQVNTELGVAIKDEAHQIYNVSRKLAAELEIKHIDPKTDPEYRKLLDAMQDKWDLIPIMKGTPVVPTEKAAKSKNPAEILYVATESKYVGPSIPNGEAAIGSPEMRKLERVPSTLYGMDWMPDSPNAKIVAPARDLSDEEFNKLPVETLPHGTTLLANEGTLKKSSIDKVVSGAEPFREGYVTKLYRDEGGNLHIVDGHHRVAMYHALGKDMPVRILDSQSPQGLKAQIEYQRKIVAAARRAPEDSPEKAAAVAARAKMDELEAKLNPDKVYPFSRMPVTPEERKLFEQQQALDKAERERAEQVKQAEMAKARETFYNKPFDPATTGTVTNRERQAVMQYSGAYGHEYNNEELNAELRAGKMTPQGEKMRAELDATASKMTLAQPVSVERVITNRAIRDQILANIDNPTFRYHEPGFSSVEAQGTSPSLRDMAMRYSGGQGGKERFDEQVFIRAELPAGTHAIDVTKLVGDEPPPHLQFAGSEQEFIMPRGTTWRIVGVEHEPDAPAPVIRMELVNGGKTDAA